MMDYTLIGKKTVTIGQEVFGPELIGSDGITVTITPATVSVESMDGTTNIPTGAFDEISATINLIIPNVETLMRIFPGISLKATGKGMTGGQVVFGGETCVSTETVPVIIHNFCSDGSEDDVQIPNAIIQAGGEFTFNRDDPVVLELNVTPTKGTLGYVIFGQGRLDVRSKFNPATGQYEPLTAATDSVTVNPATLTVAAGKTATTQVTVSPQNAAAPTVESANTKLATATVVGNVVTVTGVAATPQNQPVNITVTSGERSVTVPVTVTAN